MADYILKPQSETRIQDLIDMAFAAGGGRVVLEPDIHQSGTIYLKSNVELHLEAGAILRGHTSPDLYDELRAPIVTNYVDRLTINNLKTKFQQP